MQERVKVFTYVSGTGTTAVESSLDDQVNEWLQRRDGQLVRVTQSESERQGATHITLCIWYRPNE